MILADKIIQLRKEKGWTQEELAEKLDVSRQAISKWEGARSVPDLERILRLAKLFGVSTDYLLKDDAVREDESLADDADDPLPPLRHVSLETAHAYLELRRRAATGIAGGVALMIFGLALLILILGLTEQKILPVSEGFGVFLGMVGLLVPVAIGCAWLVMTGQRSAAYEYIETEPLDTAYGVDGVVREQWSQFRPAYTRDTVVAIVLFILGVLPIIAGGLQEEHPGLVLGLIAAGIALMGVGSFFIIRAMVRQSAFEKLLEVGDYTKEKKELNRRQTPFKLAYWLTMTALYLLWSFLFEAWDISWLLWPVAVLLYIVLLSILAYRRRAK